MSRLPVPVTLSAPRNSWICEDWSGVSTPGGVFNGTVVEPGSKHPFRLELHRNAAGNFILRVEGIEERSLNAAAIAGEAELTAITRTNWALYPRKDRKRRRQDQPVRYPKAIGCVTIRPSPSCTFYGTVIGTCPDNRHEVCRTYCCESGGSRNRPSSPEFHEPVRRVTRRPLVGEGGLEPPRGFPHWHLKPARLPFRHSPEWKPNASNPQPSDQP